MIKNGIQKFSKISFGFVGLAVVLVAVLLPLKEAFAANDYVPLTTVPGAFTAGQSVNPVNVVKNIYGVSIGVAALLAVAMIIWAGVEYVTTEAIEGKSNAKEKWEGAIWGLVLLLGAYIILRTINVSLVNIDLSNLTKPCGTGATQSGVPCGDRVTAGATQAIAKMASAASASYQQSQADLAAAQKALETAKASGDAAKIAAAQQSLNSATINNASKAITQKTNLAMTGITTALAGNDVQSVQTLAKVAADATLQNLQTLQQTPGVDKSVLTSATTQVDATKVFQNQAVQAGTILQDAFVIKNSDTSTKITVSPGAASALSQLIDSIKTTATTASTKDPVNAAQYQSTAQAMVDSINTNLSKKMECASVIISSNSVVCKN